VDEFLERIGRLWRQHEKIQPTEDNLAEKLAKISQLDGVTVDMVTGGLIGGRRCRNGCRTGV
jgi:hypothetical protein